MSQDERDYYYDPKPFRGGPRGKPPRKPHGVFFYIVVWAIIGFSIFAVISERKSSSNKPSGTRYFNAPCEALPRNGGVFVIEPSILRRTDLAYSGFDLTSGLAVPAVVVISNPEMTTQYQSVSVHPGQSAGVSLPVGKYGVSILTGNNWCNIRDGFINGDRVVVSSPLEIKQGETTTLSMRPDVNTTGKLLLSLSYVSLAEKMAETLPKQLLGNGYTDLRRDRTGHYKIGGGINGIQTEFMVDTGASITSINNRLAIEAGIQSCTPRIFNTAGGKVTGCIGFARKLVFGNFTLENAEVAIMPELGENLLGMNALGRLNISQQGDVMRISLQ